MNDVPRLKPCPFCGADEAVYLTSISEQVTTCAECSVCFARTRKCAGMWEAARAWNCRAKMEGQDERLNQQTGGDCCDLRG